MSVQLSGGTIINTTFNSNGTRLQLVNQLETALSAAGWTAISGAGSSDWVYESAATPAGHKCRVECLDPGGANVCAQFKLRSGAPNNIVATLAQSYFMQPINTASYRIWANKYSFFFFKSGTIMTDQRAFVCAGTLYVWDFLVPILNGSPWVCWMHGSGKTDTDTTSLTSTWRNTCGGNVVPTGFTSIWNEVLQSGTAAQFFLNARGQAATVGNDWQFEDGSYLMYEPLVQWYTGIGSVLPFTIHGQLWDAVCTPKQYTSEDIRTIGNLKWLALTHQASSTGMRCGLLLFIP